METKSTNTWYLGAHVFRFFGILAMWINSMSKISLSLRTKYDDSRNRNNFMMRTISHIKKSQLDWYLCAPLLPFVSFCYPQIQFANNAINTILDRGKAPIRENELLIQSPTMRSAASAIWTPRFRTCLV